MSSDEESETQQQFQKEDYDVPASKQRRTGILPRQNMVDHSFERSVDSPYVIGQSRLRRKFSLETLLAKADIRHGTFCESENRVKLT